MRVNSIARFCVVGSEPGMTRCRTIGAAKREISSATTAYPSTISVRTLEASRHALRVCPRARKPVKTGMKAEPNAPAITTEKIRSGMRKAAT